MWSWTLGGRSTQIHSPPPFSIGSRTVQRLSSSSLGGYFALKHYLDYRDTGDVDAWWRTRQDARALAVAREVFAETAAEFGYRCASAHGEKRSRSRPLDGANKAFSFQVSIRSVEIGEPVAEPLGALSDRDAGRQHRVEDDGAGRARRASRLRGHQGDRRRRARLDGAVLGTVGGEEAGDRARRCPREGSDAPRKDRSPHADRAAPRRAQSGRRRAARVVPR